MTTGQLAVAIIVLGAVIGAAIYMESTRRHARATKAAERRRREQQERKLRDVE